MDYDYSKLNGRIAEMCGTQAVFAQRMGISEHTISLKLNAKRHWKQPEIQKACDVLGLSDNDVGAYFFARKVQ